MSTIFQVVEVAESISAIKSGLHSGIEAEHTGLGTTNCVKYNYRHWNNDSERHKLDSKIIFSLIWNNSHI